LADTANAVPLARLHITDVVSRWGVHPSRTETLRLLASELAGNAVRHPNDEKQLGSDAERHVAQTFEVTLEMVADVVRLSVWDRDPRPPVVKHVGVEATAGRGVFIVAAISQRWGWYPAHESPGKVVWAEVPVLPEKDGAVGPERGARHVRDEPNCQPIDPNVVSRALAPRF
jgi:anti-sigma regulatory factor (Ser/Thr protein kinase)